MRKKIFLRIAAHRLHAQMFHVKHPDGAKREAVL